MSGYKNTGYEVVIGLEVHVELNTATKIFCSCSTAFGAAPNTQVCPVCTGMPGVLPVLNRQVLEKGVAVGLATNCTITQQCKFDRKNYFYPDLPKAFQTSQLYLPICRNGFVEIETEAGAKKVRIHEIHMEEDAGKLNHEAQSGSTLIDYNRCGVPLLEIVSEPDMTSADEVLAYLETHYRDPDLSQGQVADEFRISVYTLSRMFKKQVGVGFVEYVNYKRMEYAKELLLTTDYPVKTIAVMCGFANDNYFSKYFKNVVGESPSSFREI